MIICPIRLTRNLHDHGYYSFHVLGVGITIVPLYLVEISPVNLRGAIATIHQLLLTIGIVVAQVGQLLFEIALAITISVNNLTFTNRFTNLLPVVSSLSL